MKTRLIPRTPGLTPGYGANAERQHAMTVAGMAHFAASGPFGCVCKDCQAYGAAYQRIRNAAGEIIKTQNRPHACGVYQQMTGRLGGDIPPHTEGCKYFASKSGA